MSDPQTRPSPDLARWPLPLSLYCPRPRLLPGTRLARERSDGDPHPVGSATRQVPARRGRTWAEMAAAKR